MTFYDRYAAIAEKMNLEPCSQKAADMFGVTRATISTWNSKKTTPKGETIALMADKLGVSADYLLGRTDDPTDYTKGGIPIPVPDQTPSNTAASAKTVSFKKPVVNDNLIQLIGKLDASDRLRAEGVIQGLLMQDKYIYASELNAAHIRTDINVTSDMIDHDEKIMDDEDF